MKEERKLLTLIGILVLAIVFVIGGTFSYWQWSTSEEQMTLVNSSITGAEMHIGDPTENLKDLYPTSDCDPNGTSSWVSEVTVYNNTGVTLASTFKLKVKIEDKDGNVITNNKNQWNSKEYRYYIRYAVTEENGQCNAPLYSGRFGQNVPTNSTTLPGWYDSPSITLRDSNGFPNVTGRVNSGVSFYAGPNKITKHKYKIYAWIDKDYTSMNYGQQISDPLQNAKISVSWSENSGLEQVRKSYTGTAYAVYSATDNSLRFYRSETPITQGSTYKGRKVTNVYTGFETATYTYAGGGAPWSGQRTNIKTLVFEDYIYPISTAQWFTSLSLESMDISKLDTSRVTDMSMMFYATSTTTPVDLSQLDTSNVTNMSSMFEYGTIGSHNYTTLAIGDISNWDVSNVTDMSYIFDQASYNKPSELSKLGDLSKWNVCNVTNGAGFGTMVGSKQPNFRHPRLCKGDIQGDAYAVYSATDNSLRFYRSETPITVGSTYNGRTVTNVYTGFEKTTTSNIPWESVKSNINIVNFEDYVYPLSTSGWFSDMETDTLNITQLNTSNVTNMSAMFAMATGDITGLRTLDTSKVTDMNYMFYSTWGRDYSDIENWNVSNVTNMHHMFGYSTIESLDLSSWKVSSLEDVGGMFSYANINGDLNLSNWSSQHLDRIYYSYSILEETKISGDLIFKNWNMPNLTTLNGLFSMTEINGTLDLGGWNTSYITDLTCMFYYMSAGNIINFDTWDTSNVTKMIQMLSGSTIPNINLSSWNVCNVTTYDSFSDSFTGNLTPPYFGNSSKCNGGLPR